jgi:hypothetical protein
MPFERLDYYFVIFIGDLTIYGQKVRSTYPEDRYMMETAESHGWIYTESFSKAAPTGEFGTQPAAGCLQISREQFEEARAQGWPDAVVHLLPPGSQN